MKPFTLATLKYSTLIGCLKPCDYLPITHQSALVQRSLFTLPTLKFLYDIRSCISDCGLCERAVLRKVPKPNSGSLIY